MFWCTKSVKFHFRWGTKPRDQKQETGNDCDVISRLEVSGKTDLSDIFLYLINNALFKLKVLKWRHNHPQCPVFGLAVLCPIGSEISRFWFIKRQERKIAIEFFLQYLHLSVHCGDFIEQIKKICRRHFKRTMPEALLLLNIQTGKRRAWLYQRLISFCFLY